MMKFHLLSKKKRKKRKMLLKLINLTELPIRILKSRQNPKKYLLKMIFNDDFENFQYYTKLKLKKSFKNLLSNFDKNYFASVNTSWV